MAQPVKKDEKKKESFFSFLPTLPKPWSRQQAEGKEKELRQMWQDYGEYADSWLQRQCKDESIQIWDFTDKELDAVMKWCLRRGQSNGAVAMALDLALEGKTDIDFAVIIGGKALETGYQLSKRPRRPK